MYVCVTINNKYRPLHKGTKQYLKRGIETIVRNLSSDKIHYNCIVEV